MMEQIRIEKVSGDFNYFNEAGTGKPQASQNVKLDTGSKKWLTDIGNAVSEATGNNKYGASSVAREAIHFYRHFYQHRQKLQKYQKSVLALLDSLP